MLPALSCAEISTCHTPSSSVEAGTAEPFVTAITVAPLSNPIFSTSTREAAVDGALSMLSETLKLRGTVPVTERAKDAPACGDVIATAGELVSRIKLNVDSVS